MKRLKKVFKVCALALVISLVSPALLPISSVNVVEAATIKLSKKAITLVVGKSKTLKVTGTKQKITWASSKKTVATVNKAGKVVAKKAGTATITATVNKKKYTCKVTVKKADIVNKLIENAPFEAKEDTASIVNYILPKAWTKNVLAEEGKSIMLALYPETADTTKGTSNLSLIIQETGTLKPEYSLAKEYLAQASTEEIIIAQLAQIGMDATLEDYKTSDYETTLGTAFKIEYKAVYEGGTMNQVIYDLYIDNYLIQVTVTDIGDKVNPDVNIVGEYLLNSIQVKK